MQKSKYLVANERDARWGLTVSTVGYDEVHANEPYPTPNHPDGYFCDSAKGRVLNEYQLLYLVEGEGLFMSDHQQTAKIKSGDFFLLFPGEWHTYHPLPGKKWKSYWIGYKGRNMDDRVRAGFLSPEKPIYHVGYSADIVNLYRSALKASLEEAAFVQQTLAGIVNHLIGLMYSLERNNILNKDIREALESPLSIQQIASEMSVSYSNFRKLFKEYTGISPALYQQDLKLQRAKELLSTTDLSIKEIAYQLNFESPDYFSSKFKTKTGLKPSDFRQQTK